MKHSIILIAIFSAQQVLAYTVHPYRSTKSAFRDCRNDGYYLVQDTLKDGQLERNLYLQDDSPTADKSGIRKKMMGPKVSYSVKEAITIMKFNDEEELITMAADNGGWKCVSINEIGDFNDSAKKYFDTINPKPKKKETFLDTLKKWNKKWEGQR
jgi:hypothetical protein